MGTKYSTQTATGYNASPPSDDGTAVSTNEVKWSFVKTKIGDPVKTLAEGINTKLLTHFDEKVVDKATAYTTTAAEHKQTINVTASATISLGDAATMAAGYIVTVKNSHTAANTVDLATGADTLDGTAAGSISLAPDAAMTFVTNAAVDGYYKASMNIGDDLTIANDLTVTNDLTVSNDATVTGELKVEAYSEDADQYTVGSGTIDFDVSLATYFYPDADFGVNTPTFTFSNPAASGRVSSFILELLGADGATITWPTSVDWSEGSEPTWTAGVDIVSFVTRDNGTTWMGFLGGLDFS